MKIGNRNNGGGLVRRAAGTPRLIVRMVVASAALVAVLWSTPTLGQENTTAPPAPSSPTVTTVNPNGLSTKRQEIFTSPPPPPPSALPDGKTTDWFDDAKHPVSWLSWGADLRLREVYFDNAITLNGQAANHERRFERIRARVWSTISPSEQLDLNLRLVWEGRYYGRPASVEGWYGGITQFDQLNFKLKNPGELPMTLQVGRQEIIMGDGWLVIDASPLDGSRTISFDAVRFAWDFENAATKLELIYIDQGGADDRLIHPINDLEEDQSEQDERGAIVWLTNKSITATQLDGFFIYKADEAQGGPLRQAGGLTFASPGNDGESYTLGGRVQYDFNKYWKVDVQGAGQVGDRNGREVRAGAAKGALIYSFNDAWKTQLKGTYEYLSGDDPNTAGRDEAFDPLWGRWPQWSELLVYTYAAETRLSQVTNLHRLGLTWNAKPTEKLELLANYHFLLADENTRGGTAGYSAGGDVRGHLISAVLRYKFNSHVSGHLTGEVFLPGNYYAAPRDDTAAFLRAEVVLAF